MDALESDHLHTALKAQGLKLHQQDQQIAQICHELSEATYRAETQSVTVSAQLSHVIIWLQSLDISSESTAVVTLGPPVSAPEQPEFQELHSIRLSSPERLLGDSGDWQPFT